MWLVLLRKIKKLAAVRRARIHEKFVKSDEASKVKSSDVTIDLERKTDESSVSSELPNKSSKKTRKKSRGSKRKQTDVCYLLLFALLFCSWISAIVFAISTGTTSKDLFEIPSRACNETDPTAEKCVKPCSDGVTLFNERLSSLKAKLSSITWQDVNDFAKDYAVPVTIVLTTSIALIFTTLALARTILNSPTICKATLTRVSTILCVCVILLVRKPALTDTLLIAALILWMNAYKAALKRRPYIDTSRLLCYTSDLLKFYMLTLSTVCLVIVLTTTATLHTARTDPIRYFILVGCYVALDFVMRFVHMVLAFIATTYHKTSCFERLRNRSVWVYVRIVARCHLGSVALSTMSMFPLMQSFEIMLRHALMPTRRIKGTFYQLFYRLHLMLNASDYAVVLVAKYGCDHYRATDKSLAVLIKFCSLSSVAMNRALDELIWFGMLIACVMKILIPFVKYDVKIFESSSCQSEFSTWLLLGMATFSIYTMLFYILTYTSTEHATRLYLLEEKLNCKSLGQIELKKRQLNLCLDSCTCRNRRIVFRKALKASNSFCPLERIDEKDEKTMNDLQK